MNRNSRSLSLAVTLMIALGAALAAVAFSDGQTAHAHQHAKSVTAKELKLRNDMRKLWEDHVTWTRLAVISLTSGTADTNATVARLLRNQTDIGNAVKPFYGRAAGAELTRLLKEHITIAAALITAAKAGDKPAQAAAQTVGKRTPIRSRASSAVQTRTGSSGRCGRCSAITCGSPPSKWWRGSSATGRQMSRPTTRSTVRRCTWRTCSPPASSASSRSDSGDSVRNRRAAARRGR